MFWREELNCNDSSMCLGVGIRVLSGESVRQKLLQLLAGIALVLGVSESSLQVLDINW
jgi:hypothetical protein